MLKPQGCSCETFIRLFINDTLIKKYHKLGDPFGVSFVWNVRLKSRIFFCLWKSNNSIVSNGFKQKHPKCSSSEQINKLQCIHTLEWQIKVKELKVHTPTWMNPRYTMLNEKGNLLNNNVYILWLSLHLYMVLKHIKLN